MESRRYDLEDRLIRFGVSIIRLAGKLPKTYAGNHISGQLTRSGTSPAFQYGEAQAAESRADFLHKMKVGLKELKETFVNLKMIRLLEWLPDGDLLPDLEENRQLISIFVSSIQTAERNGLQGNRPLKH
ncbi:four helix bundle protein [Flaviaesturariibacter aridisoli]|uniref:Four helix bundle protein n=2 Tax=Flaviaesturariibacter aridisoli TaxID=2545761 RepID=A0A4R4DTK6_9BACT|nr:four helix bundle protein [Flaviaesturariibacter aridisoli]